MTQQTLLAGRYRLLESAGQGGMGRVWLASDEVLGRLVAVKEVVAPDGLGAEEARDAGVRALREARAAARLNHPNVITVYDVVLADGTPWIVMEYLPSRSLFQAISEDGPMSPEEAARVGLAVLRALRAAHGVGVLHRDVKPANVLLGHDGRIMLTDFGVASIVGDSTVTRSGVVIGSPAYIAPERLREGGGDVGAPTDLWSLGATLHFAVEGRSPYERSTAVATVAALATEEPDRSPRAGPLRPVIDGLLRRDPAARLTAATVDRLLREAARGPTTVRSRPVAPRDPTEGPVPRPAIRRAVLAGAVAALLVLAVAVWVLSGPTPSPQGTGPPATTVTTAAGSRAAAPATATASRPAGAGPSAVALPAGWRTYHDRTGFSVAVPANWAVSRRGSIVYFSDPSGDRLLGIDQTDEPQWDPVADWAGKEDYRVARGDFPSYRRVRLQAVDYFIKAADWEFTYLRGGTRLHVNNRGFITSTRQAYGMWWSTPDNRWDRYQSDLALIQRTFVPAGKG